MVDEVLQEAIVRPADIERLGVCTGPGSFTGLRVALAFAKGFALPRRVPVIGLSGLEVLAAQADEDQTQSIAVVIDVRRGQVCWATFNRGIQTQTPITQDYETAKQAIKVLECRQIIGDGAERLGYSSPPMIISGEVLARLAQEKRPRDYPPVPLYSRGPDAKLPGGITPKPIVSTK